ncbi:MAG: succinyldiaminopimelate transaminase [Gammaproteobacteria bacterium]|nr:succinyldiaminopimelate transaminase [Gammaproteobacteria bacterium]
MNPDLQKLQPYPFEKLATLKNGITPPSELNHIPLSIGEPKHAAPDFVSNIIEQSSSGISSYPLTRGSDELRQSIADWLIQRFNLPADSMDKDSNVIPVNGTREALFAFAQAVIDRSSNPLVLMPNPFYQIYEGAAYLAGAQPWFMNTTAEQGFLPDFDSVPADVWQRCQLIYLCSPGNPTGAVANIAQLQKLIQLANQHDFIIASDECYSELYFDEANPPAGLLQAAAQMGQTDYSRCVVFHSLSKRSNLPGLRSGFVAGDAAIIKSFLHYRTYHGCAMPGHHQQVSIAAWSDEQHVIENRQLYKEKFDAVLPILSSVLEVEKPEAGFYLWPQTPINETEFAQQLFAQQNVTVLPGSYLSRDAHGLNPGQHRIRMALVAPLEECIDAATRIKTFVESL